jgi:hypothetical protein
MTVADPRSFKSTTGDLKKGAPIPKARLRRFPTSQMAGSTKSARR